MKNKYTIAYIGAIIAIPVALLFIVPAVATTSANWNMGDDVEASFAEVYADAETDAHVWTWGDSTEDSFVSEAESDSDAFAYASVWGDDAEAEAEAESDAHAETWSGENYGSSYAWGSGSSHAYAHVHTNSCGHDVDEECAWGCDDEEEYNWCDDHDCTPDDEEEEEEEEYNWCDDHDCTPTDECDSECDHDHDHDYDHECTWGCDDEEEETPAPTCTLDIYPSTITQGDEAVLYWQTEGAYAVSISGGVGSASLDGEEGVSPTGTQTYTLTAVGEGGTVTCSDTVGVVADEDTQEETTNTNVNHNYNYNYNTYSGGSSRNNDDDVSCDSFTVSDSNVEEGDEVTLRWKTTDADDVDINQGVGDVSDDGSEEVTVKRDTTFTLTARGDGDTDTCRVTVRVDEDEDDDKDLRCEFSVSDTSISAGQSVVFSWDNDGTDRLVLKDSFGKTLADSRKDSKIDEDMDVLTASPAKTAKYTLDVYKGSKKETCTLDVEVGKKGMVQGISLSQVPYTGFEAGPMLTALFYAAIVLWGLVLAYALVLKKKNLRNLSK
jgi:hypothetical protein